MKEYLEVLKMQNLESFPEITITNIIAEGEYVVVESTGKATSRTGKSYNQPIVTFTALKRRRFRQ